MSASPTTVLPPTRAILIGAGQRGIVYSNYALDHPELLTIIAVAEPNQERREAIAHKFQLKPEACFTDWRTILEQQATLIEPGTVALIATPDRYHHDPAVAFAKAGCHILLEKPMAVSLHDCESITTAATTSRSTIFAVCHVLRYTPVNRFIHELIRSKRIGQLINIQHLEPVGHAHFAHSYVRGNWHSEAESTFSLMAKSCHDLDLLQYWMEAQDGVGKNPVTKVSSFGSLQYFKPSNKPSTASDKCVTCPIESTCVYSAKKIYLTPITQPNFKGWLPNYLALVDTAVPDIENITDALTKGPYGECVFNGTNDVCDQQVVSLQFQSGATSSFSMISTTERACKRQTTVFGSDGEIRCDSHFVTVHDFKTGVSTVYDPLNDPTLNLCTNNVGRLIGHEGADYYLMSSFISAVRSNDPTLITSGAVNSLTSHRLVFAAEEARKKGTVIDMTTHYTKETTNKL